MSVVLCLLEDKIFVQRRSGFVDIEGSGTYEIISDTSIP